MNNHDRYKIRIVPDTDAQSPRDEGGNLGTVYAFGRNAWLSDKEAKGVPFEYVRDFIVPRCLALPLYKYEHSSIALQTRPFTSWNHAQWDSGQIGWIVADYDKIKRAYGRKRLSRKLLGRALASLEYEIADYSRWLNGESYGFVIESNGEPVDSCWGFLGYDAAEAEAISVVQHLTQQ